MPNQNLIPRTVIDDSTVGNVTWATPNEAKVADVKYAVASNMIGKVSHYLKCSNFGFTIPAGAVIDGIIVYIKRASDYNTLWSIKDSEVKLIKSDGSTGTSNKANASVNWPTTTAFSPAYGSSYDQWEEAWTVDDINNSNFGVVLSVIGSTAGSHPLSAYVDSIMVTVFYT